jgi:hypothetical protein
MNLNEGGKPPQSQGLRKIQLGSLNGSMSNLGVNNNQGSYRANPLLQSTTSISGVNQMNSGLPQTPSKN